ncbi:oligosaccharide flippase family protein [Caproiciproducens faecalis]|uniref:Oligosaccharide flippase family protein n=1 Tax=Caproiciproducens faecalis TaxID=2820301 RepID=A0ABS7DP60_9FIRM|nr:oligosaccharide flippase family protein [Caproiciproducens faecalis]MBW7572600.1 oligosaccharide flippase family protein [Caproiciproducens faecalis]
MKKRIFYLNAVILTSTSVILRMSNIWFRVFICSKIGASGMGLYQLILSVFILGITLCTSGVGLAVTRLVAEGRGTRDSIRRCVGYALSLSLVGAAAMFFFADFISVRFIGDSIAATPLRLLAPSLPFIAVCSCLKGYFLAIRNTLVPACGEWLEQFVTIGASLFLFARCSAPLNALMLGSTIGEVFSCAYIVLLYLVFAQKRGLSKAKNAGVFKSVLHIAAPVLCGSFFRSLLNSTENMLIPRGLRKYGAGESGALAQYGTMQGMVMPILYFPSAFLAALSMLLIPEMAEANAGGKRATIQRSVEKAMRFTLTFSFLMTSILIVFADSLGMAFYKSTQVGNMLRIMAPILPLMYLDSVVDGMLKGLDQQLYSLKYNFSDSVMRVILIASLVPIFGIKAYITILFMSEIYNASLSINRLLKVTAIEVDVVSWIVSPAVCAALLYYLLLLLQKAPCFAV